MKMDAIKSTFWGRAIVLVGMTLLGSSLSGQRVCCEGDRWLKWKEDVRETYVAGYAFGYTEGLRDGCVRGTKDWPGAVKPGYENIPVVKCLQGPPDFSKGTDILAKAITDFYKRYPGDRDIRITEILDLLSRGSTLEEIHNHPFLGHESPKVKP